MSKKVKKDVATIPEGEVLNQEPQGLKMRNLVFGVVIDYKEQYTKADGEKALKAVEKLMQQTRDDPASFESLLFGMSQAPIIYVPEVDDPELAAQIKRAKA